MLGISFNYYFDGYCWTTLPRGHLVAQKSEALYTSSWLYLTSTVQVVFQFFCGNSGLYKIINILGSIPVERCNRF